MAEGQPNNPPAVEPELATDRTRQRFVAPTPGKLFKSLTNVVDLGLQGNIDKEPVEYPHRWFISNPGRKPYFMYTKSTTPDREIAGAVFRSLQTQAPDIGLAIDFLVRVLPKYEGKVNEEWTSYGRKLSGEGHKVNPMSLIEAVATGDPVDRGTVGPADYPEINVIYLLTCIYRLSLLRAKGTEDMYYNKVRDRCKVLGNGICTTDELRILESVPEGCSSWGSNPAYRKLMAAIDMFLTKVNHEVLSPVKIGTVVSRGRDCGVWGDIIRLQELIGQNTHGALKWLLAPSVMEELEAISSPAEQSWDYYGYFYYMSDLGLTKKSPYASGANPRLHFLCNATALFLDGKAAPTTQWIEAANLNSLLCAAIHAAYALRAPEHLRPIFGATVDEQTMIIDILTEQQQATVSADGQAEPPRSEWAAWMVYYQGKDWQLTDNMKEWAKRFVSTITAPRDNSIGKKVKDMVASL